MEQFFRYFGKFTRYTVGISRTRFKEYEGMLLGLEPGYRGQDERLDRSALVAALALLAGGITFLLAMTFLLFPEWISARSLSTGLQASATSARAKMLPSPAGASMVLLANMDVERARFVTSEMTSGELSFNRSMKIDAMQAAKAATPSLEIEPVIKFERDHGKTLEGGAEEAGGTSESTTHEAAGDNANSAGYNAQSNSYSSNSGPGNGNENSSSGSEQSGATPADPGAGAGPIGSGGGTGGSDAGGESGSRSSGSGSSGSGSGAGSGSSGSGSSGSGSTGGSGSAGSASSGSGSSGSGSSGSGGNGNGNGGGHGKGKGKKP